MAHARQLIFLVGLLAIGCAPSRPPAELAGLWSSGPAACSAGVGVRFRANAIEAVYAGGDEVLFKRPRYAVEPSGQSFQVRITYDLPVLPGGARSAGAHGVLVLRQQPDGSLAAMRHALSDTRTGAVRVRLENDPAARLLALQPCDLRQQPLRGRT